MREIWAKREKDVHSLSTQSTYFAHTKETLATRGGKESYTLLSRASVAETTSWPNTSEQRCGNESEQKDFILPRLEMTGFL